MHIIVQNKHFIKFKYDTTIVIKQLNNKQYKVFSYFECDFYCSLRCQLTFWFAGVSWFYHNSAIIVNLNLCNSIPFSN